MVAFLTVNAYGFSNDSVRQDLNSSHDAGSEERKMTTCAKFADYLRTSAVIFFLTSLLVVTGNVFASEADIEKRLSVTTQNSRVQRDDGIPGITTQDEFAALQLSGERVKGMAKSALSKGTTQSSQSPNVDYWFYMADVILFNDHDNDGYYHGIDLLFDADTYYTSAEVYAVVYLSLDGGPWNEYAATEDFTIFGTTSDDEYVIVTELLEGYPSGSYDILIELFDAYDDSYLAYFGPDDTSELAFLPLEDADRDAVVVPDVIVVDNHHHGGGSSGWLFILTLGLAVLCRRYVWRSA